MTKILFWNVNNFGTNGFYPGPNARQRAQSDDRNYGTPAAPGDAHDRLAVVIGVIANVAPDIVVIVEVQPGRLKNVPGELLKDEASYKLLLSIRNDARVAGAQEFCLVPPLVCGVDGNGEGVAVYYRKDRLQFLGPYGWTGGMQAQPVDATHGPAQLRDYPGCWGAALPNRVIERPWPNGDCREDRLAGQFTFVQFPGAPELTFPESWSRSPWLTCFRDLAGNRWIKLLSFHAVPHVESAVLGTRRIAQIAEITGPPADNEVRCIVGDFNVSSFDATNRALAFGPLMGVAQYKLQFNPAAAGIGPGLPAEGYYTTILQRAANVTPWISIKKGSFVYGYPAFGYMGSGAIDNALTRHGANAGAAKDMTVCNPVTGAPYKRNPNPPGPVLQGTYAVDSYLSEKDIFAYSPPAKMGIDGTDPGADDATLLFRKWENYMQISSTSDHLPIALDV